MLFLDDNLLLSSNFSMENIYKLKKMVSDQFPDGLGVRISGFHPDGPGSIPGLGGRFFI